MIDLSTIKLVDASELNLPEPKSPCHMLKHFDTPEEAHAWIDSDFDHHDKIKNEMKAHVIQCPCGKYLLSKHASRIVLKK